MKREEDDAFRCFCKTSGLLAYEDFTYRDRPDFRNRDGTIGVELVSYHRDARTAAGAGSPHRQWEAGLGRLLTEAQELLPAGTPPAEVYVFPRPRVTGLIPRNAALTLAGLVADRIAGNSGAAIPAPLDQVVDDVWVEPAYQPMAWGVAEAGNVDVSVASVQAILDSKEERLSEYRGHVNTVWLLIYGSLGPYVGPGNVGRLSTCGHVTPALRQAAFESSFDRVYYLDLDRPEHALLRLRPRPTTPR